jgi:hypothetical protein
MLAVAVYGAETGVSIVDQKRKERRRKGNGK